MKTLFITSWYPTEKNPSFGIFIKEHALAVHSAGIEIVVFAVILEKSASILKTNVKDFIDENGIRTIQLIISSKLKDVLYYFPSIQNIIFRKYYSKTISKSFSPDIIHSHVVFPAGILGDSLSKKLKKPHIITEHWSKLPYILSYPLLKFKIKSAYKNAVKTLPVSDFLKKRIQSSIPELADNKFEIIPNVVNSDIFKFQKKTLDNSTICFTAIATWATKRQPDKKPELFIEALASVQNKIPQKIKLMMLGGGDRVNELKNLCKEKNIDAEFKERISKPEIADVLHHSHFLLHASTIETFGIVALEALMTGTPVICSNVGALPEIINKNNGILCENTLNDWQNAILKAIETNFDNEKISQSVQAKYSTKAVGEKIESVYTDFLSS